MGFTYTTPMRASKGTDQFVYAIFDSGSPVATRSGNGFTLPQDPGNDILLMTTSTTPSWTFRRRQRATNDENPDGPAGTGGLHLGGRQGPSNGTWSSTPMAAMLYTPNPTS